MAYRRRSKCIGRKNGISGCRNCCKGNKKCLKSCMKSKPRRKSRRRSRKRSRKRSKKYYKKKKSNKIKSRRKMSNVVVDYDYYASAAEDRSRIAQLTEARLRADIVRALNEGRIHPEYTVWDYLKKKGLCPYSLDDPFYRQVCYSGSGLPVLHTMREWNNIFANS